MKVNSFYTDVFDLFLQPEKLFHKVCVCIALFARYKINFPFSDVVRHKIFFCQPPFGFSCSAFSAIDYVNFIADSFFYGTAYVRVMSTAEHNSIHSDAIIRQKYIFEIIVDFFPFGYSFFYNFNQPGAGE